MADCWGASDNAALGAEIIMLPIDNFFRAAALWPERIAVEIADADRCQQTSYAAQPGWQSVAACRKRFIRLGLVICR
ncbi:hypothetical protein OAN83_00910 [Alphaproteobacteria bacterium]|nr:hypothetical protein [Alphaproteobacteria bacterium]